MAAAMESERDDVARALIADPETGQILIAGYQWWSTQPGGRRFNMAWGHGGAQIALAHDLDMVSSSPPIRSTANTVTAPGTSRRRTSILWQISSPVCRVSKDARSLRQRGAYAAPLRFSCGVSWLFAVKGRAG